MLTVVHISKVTGIAGSENHLLRLLPGLLAQGVEARLIVLEDPRYPVASFRSQMKAKNVAVDVLPIRWHLDPALPGLLTRRLHELHPDIVHTHLIHADFYGLPAARRAGIRYLISSRHNDDAFRRHTLIKWLNRRLMRRAGRVIAISHALARFVREVENVDAGKVVTVHYGLDTPSLPPDACQQARERLGLGDEPLIGASGRLIRQKGLDVLLDAFAIVRQRHPAARLVILGDGPLRRDLEDRASRLGLAAAVTFTGWRDDARTLTPALDVAVVPSRWEGFGMVTLEAMACAKPLVVSRVSALPEIVVEGQTGLCVPPDDPPALAEAIGQLLANPDHAARMGRAGYDRLVTEFSVEKMVGDTLRVYQDLVGAS